MAKVRCRRLAIPAVRDDRLPEYRWPSRRIADALPLPRYFCVTCRLDSSDRTDAMCLLLPTMQSFTVECGWSWVRVYVPPGRGCPRSLARSGVVAESIVKRFTEAA